MARFAGLRGRPGTDSRAGVAPAVWLLLLATVVVLTCLTVQQPLLVAASGVLALVMGWASLHVAWTVVVASRRKHAALLRLLHAKEAELARLTRLSRVPGPAPVEPPVELPLLVHRSPVNWSGLEPDLVSSLLAWERHTAEVVARRTASPEWRSVS